MFDLMKHSFENTVELLTCFKIVKNDLHDIQQLLSGTSQVSSNCRWEIFSLVKVCAGSLRKLPKTFFSFRFLKMDLESE